MPFVTQSPLELHSYFELFWISNNLSVGSFFQDFMLLLEYYMRKYLKKTHQTNPQRNLFENEWTSFLHVEHLLFFISENVFLIIFLSKADLYFVICLGEAMSNFAPSFCYGGLLLTQVSVK